MAAVNGFAAALGILTKYSTAMLLGALLLHLLSSPKLRERLRSPGVYAAFAVFAVVLAPHFLWLVRHDFPSFKFYGDVAGRPSGILTWLFTPVRFVLAQLLDLLPAFLIAGAAAADGVRAQFASDPSL